LHELGQNDNAAGPGLARRLGLTTATALIVGEVIGVGIFLAPAGMAKSLGSPFWLLAVWLTMGVAASGGALCYGALAARYPEAGGSYVYLREVYGPRMAFLYGWLSLLVTDPGLTAMLAVGLARYAGHLGPLSPWGLKAIAIGAVAALALVNMLGIRFGSRVLGALAGLKLTLLGFLVIWGFSFGHGDWSNLTPFWSQRHGSDPLPQGLAAALILAFISLAGWWDVSKIAGEIRDPGRTLPRALMLGLSIVTVIYIAVSTVFLYLVPPARIASDEAFAALAGEALFGRSGEILFAAIIVISVAGSLAAVLMASPRVYYAMARDGLFFPSLATIDPRRGTPARAVAIQATLAIVLVFSGTFDQILSYFMVPTLAFLALTVAAVFVLRRHSSAEHPFAIPGYPLAPILFLVPILIVIVLRMISDPLRSSIGLLTVALGVPVSGWVLSKRRASGETSATRMPDEQAVAPLTAIPSSATGELSSTPTISVKP
jgi:APA family basic amino acid/polyamine antiporter